MFNVYGSFSKWYTLVPRRARGHRVNGINKAVLYKQETALRRFLRDCLFSPLKLCGNRLDESCSFYVLGVRFNEFLFKKISNLC